MKKFYLALLTFLLVFTVTGCSLFGNKTSGSVTTTEETKTTVSNVLTFKQEDGSELPKEITAELGQLCSIPKVVAKKGNNTFEVTVKVTDKDNKEIKINNNKVRTSGSGDYTITYTCSEGSVTITIKVVDKTAPVISLTCPDGMAVLLNQNVVIPTAKVSDSSSSELTYSTTVKDKDGKEVTITDNKFVASVIGEYYITYTAIDTSGNVGTKTLTVSCENADLLNDFESASKVTYFGWTGEKEVVTENANTGNGVKLTINDDTNYTYRPIFVPLMKGGEYVTYEELLQYEKVQVYLWISEDNEFGLCNRTSPVTKGTNVLVYTKEEIEAAYAFSDTQYTDNANGFYLNLRYQTNGLTLILDDFLGIYSRDYKAPEEPDYTIELLGADGMVIPVGKEYAIPDAIVLDKDGKTANYTVTVKKVNGDDIQLVEGKFTPAEIGDYVVTYKVNDQISKTMTIKAKQATVLNNFEELTNITAATFVHSDFELVTNCLTGTGVKIACTEGTNWPQVYIPFYAGEEFISVDDLKKFEKIQIIFKSQQGGEASIANGDPRIKFTKGVNVVEFDIDKIKACMATISQQYVAGKNGFYLTFPLVSTGDEFVFIQAIGVYADDYDPNKQEEKVAKAVVNAVNGMTFIVGEENELPYALYKDANGDVVEHTVTVKDSNGSALTVTNNKVTIETVGTYTVTYSAQGFEDKVYTFSGKKGWILNDFNATTDVIYCGKGTILPGEVFAFGKSVLIKFDDADNPYLALKDKDGLAINKPQASKLADVKKMQFVIYANAAVSFELADGTHPISLVEGWNVVEFDLTEITIANYLHDTSGYIGYVRNAAGIKLTFDRIIAILADDYTESVVTDPISSVEMVNGLVVLKNEEFTLPVAEYKDNKGQDVEYTVEVKDSKDVAVTVTNNKVTFTELGTYTVTYKAQGFDDKVYTVNVKNGWVLNDFNAAGDIIYSPSTDISTSSKAIYGSSVLAKYSAGTNSYFALKDKNGASINSAEVAQLADVKYINILVYASAAVSFELSDGTHGISLVEGWNSVQFDLSEFTIASHMHPTSGFITFVRNATGINLTFDRFNAILADDYTEPVVTDPISSVEMVNGLVVLKNEEFTLPIATYKDNHAQSVNYTVSVKDSNDQAVTVSEGKVTFTELGTYTVTYSAQGFEDKVYTVNVKNGWVLNDFNAAGDIIYSPSTDISTSSKAIYGSSVLAKYSAGTNSYFALKDKNGASINSAEVARLADVKYINILVYASAAVSFELSDGTHGISLVEGWNSVQFDLSEFTIASHMHPTSGFITFVRNATGINLTFDRFNAILADDYTEPKEPVSYKLNGFSVAETSSTDGIAYNTQISSFEKTTDGLKVTLNDSNWSYMWLSLYKEGERLTIEQVKEFDKITLTFDSSAAIESFGIAEKLGKSIVAGENTIVFTQAELAECVYDETGFKVQFKATVKDETLTFKSIVGTYSADYVEKGVIVNGFTDAKAGSSDGIYYTQYISSYEKVEDGTKVVMMELSWNYMYFTLTKGGVALTTEEFAKIDKLVFCLDSSVSVSRFGNAEVLERAIVEGENYIIFTKDDLANATYDASGLKMQFNALSNGDTITFKYIKAYFAEEAE